MQQTPAAASARYGATLLRVGLGIMWIAHALLKWFVFTLPVAARFFESVGLPGVWVYPVVAAELAGGAALVLGVYARQVSVALVPIMTVALWVHLPHGWVHTSPGGGWEYPAFLILASVSLWLVGDGALALRRSARLTPGARTGRS